MNAEIPLDKPRPDAVERLEEWESDDQGSDYEYEIESSAQLSHDAVYCKAVHLTWRSRVRNQRLSVTAGGTGVLEVNDERHPPWHTNDKPADLAATIHAALNAAERAERAETESSTKSV